jgi:hypothetical protein
MFKDSSYYGYANERFMNFVALKLVSRTLDVNVNKDLNTKIMKGSSGSLKLAIVGVCLKSNVFGIVVGDWEN